MTMNAQFCCILRGQKRFCDAVRPGRQGMKPASDARKGSYQAFHAAGALRETTQSRSHDPTAQPHK